MISVVLCAHNPRRPYLQRTLQALQQQTLPPTEWELLLIDNASHPPLAAEVALGWHSQGRHVHEPILGLTPARMRGIIEAKGDLVAFVDDDTVLAPNYLENVRRLAQEHTRLGCFGAAIIQPEFEVPLDPRFRPYLSFLTVRDVPADCWSNQPADGILPWGAGLVVRIEVARQYVREATSSPLRKMLDRSGTTVMAGGDDEFSWVACRMGYGKGIFRALQLTHLIPKERLQPNYLLRVVEGSAASEILLQHLHGQPPPPLPDPSFRRAFGLLCRGRVSQFLVALNEAINRFRLDPWSRELALARARGRHKGQELVHTMSSAS